MENIGDLLKEEQILLHLQSTTKESVIEELADILDQNGKLTNKRTYIEAVRKREAEYSTGIGRGIAIPHGKSTAVKEPSIVFGRSSIGIDYDSMDQKPAHLFIMIAVPENSDNVHLKILSSLSRKLMHAKLREGLMNAGSASEILSILEES